jgi:3-oxoacyl-[acyl-carrier-protein] synthase II
MVARRIVITGMGIVSCLGNDPEIFYQRLLAGQSGISSITQFPTEGLASTIAGVVPDFDPEDFIDKRQARRVDRAIAFALVAGKKALLSANLPIEPSSLVDPSRCGVIIGSGIGGMSTFFENSKIYVERGASRVSPFLIPFILTDMSSALLAKDLGYMGPNYSISTACATSNYCIIAAASHIEKGEADLIVCGGTEAGVSPIGVAGFGALKALSTRNDDPQGASRPFDKGRDGFVIAEGCGVLVLESLESAKRRNAPILAEYLGGAISCDAHHMTEPRPDGLGIGMCIDKALRDSHRHIQDVSYINMHATSTPVGDMTEIRALEHIFDHPEAITINATKSMTGHALGAAGGIEAIATVQAIRTGYVHPTINLQDPELIHFDLPREKKRLDIRCALSNSFGFGGHNATIVLAPFVE